MQIRDLIAELKRYPETAKVCVEVLAENAAEFSECACSMNFTVESVEPENDDIHGVKITLCP